MEKQVRNQSIDLVKIIAMFGVMALHTCVGKADELSGFLLSRTFGLSMPLFFMVSGYLMQGRDVDWKYSVRKVWGILRFTFIICFAYWFVHSIRHGLDLHLFSEIWLGSFVQQGPFYVFWYFGSMMLLYIFLPYYNKMEMNTALFYPKMIAVLLGVVFCTFMADYIFGFEKLYVAQTFRLWYWLLFFTFGQLLKHLNRGGQKIHISFGYVLFFYITLMFFVWVSRTYQNGIEYFFGANLMMLYALSMFVYISQIQIKSSRLITELSVCFLPVYAIHNFVIAYVHKMDGILSLGGLTIYIDYILVVAITLGFSWLLMKIPFMNKIFKI